MVGITSVLNVEVVHFCVFRGLCDQLIAHPGESCLPWCIIVCDLETSLMKRPWLTEGCHAKDKQTNEHFCVTWIALY